MYEFWRCERCNSLLGILDQHDIRLKNKSEITIVSGENYAVSRVCRRCQHKNVLDRTGTAVPAHTL
jgi:RNase P subunit RPR2